MSTVQPHSELIVKARPEAGLRVSPAGLTSVTGADTGSLGEVCARYGGTMRPLFGVGEERLRREATRAPAAATAPDLSVYYGVDAPADQLHTIAAQLRQQPLVQAAYVKPPPEPPHLLLDLPPRAEEAPAATPDFSDRQGYLGPAPGGLGPQHIWHLPGGKGAGVRIIDIEAAWRFTHEDLSGHQGGLVGGLQSPDLVWRNHGTAVAGLLSGDDNTIGIRGICPDATLTTISIFERDVDDTNSAAAIRNAALRLSFGDILLIELHRTGPRHDFATSGGQQGRIPVEWWPDDFDAIRFATDRGIIVVEAGGNGGEDLDDQLYDIPAPGFPADWANPFRRGSRDSGAILVGSGAPPPGTHGRDHGPDRSRLAHSNFGSAVDVQGWGLEVSTCGYGDLQGGSNEDLWYTDQFNGTSSASPMIAGVLACIQGSIRAAGLAPFHAAEARRALRETGSSQQDAPGRPSSQRIGNRPDVAQLTAVPHGAKPQPDKDAKESTLEKTEKEAKETKDAKEAVKEHKDGKEKSESSEKAVSADKSSPEKAVGKDLKELKEEKEGKDAPEDAAPVPHLGMPQTGADKNIADRLAGLEQVVAQLTHFIGPDLRPDLTSSALVHEQPALPDVRVLSAELRRQADEAKNAKDCKDLEKFPER
ncbi:S8 family serine peptidase [Catellatospora chokoriensis]|uniref:Peptidase S8/S53 domain-containing protein n=1 Tax=Catellatospora chokoriensis TaxID=310353 RepID=A0A8J3KC98_9ACTN|nr:S8 family serine peptidase [Catellatospora chokoriensis]GIF94128.1 hypothetical protein Cch02nite_75720 [Catellatospora chokoriensis]